MSAGPSTVSVSGNRLEMSDRERQLYETFRDFDDKTFDWDAFAGTYKGERVFCFNVSSDVFVSSTALPICVTWLLTTRSIALTSGRALITRLSHLSSLLRVPPPHSASVIGNDPAQTPSALFSAAKETLRRALDTIKTRTLDKEAYARAITQLDLIEGYEAGDAMMNEGSVGLSGPNADMEWVERVEEEGKREAGKLDVELKGYMSNLIKESIRVSRALVFCRLAAHSTTIGCVT